VTTAADGTLQIHDGSGAVVAQVGDTVRLSGGEVSSAVRYTPTEIKDHCEGPYWLAGSGIRQEE
jgi:trimethylamine:corrinoid methyltransferase-like protein